MDTLKNLIRKDSVIKILENRGLHSNLVTIAYHKKRRILKDFGFIYILKEKVEKITKLKLSLLYKNS
jgi:hypothetical protein